MKYIYHVRGWLENESFDKCLPADYIVEVKARDEEEADHLGDKKIARKFGTCATIVSNRIVVMDDDVRDVLQLCHRELIEANSWAAIRRKNQGGYDHPECKNIETVRKLVDQYLNPAVHAAFNILAKQRKARSK